MKKARLYRKYLLLFVLFQCLKHGQSKPSLGKVRGKTVEVLDKYVYAYLGIPFAAPPVGDLRFREPQPVKPWNSVYNATQLPPSCMQIQVYPIPEWLRSGKEDITEDCLYINVWTPAGNAGKPFTTMVWIYGGGFLSGSSNWILYDGAIMAALGNVIVVTFNYRLGSFGYANFNHEEPTGNTGMMDQVLALKWVHRNIKTFGGDKKSITLFGESAGSVSIAHHLISPLTKGLFRRAILQSGSNYDNLFTVKPEDNIKSALEIGMELGCSKEDLLKCMRNLKASELVTAEEMFLRKKQSLLSFSPQSGAPYLPEDHIQAINSGQFHDVDVLIGETRDEGSILVGLRKPNFFAEDNPILTKPEAKYILGKLYGLEGNALDTVVEHFLGNVSEEDFPTILKQTVKAIGDGTFSCPIFLLSEKLSAYNRKVYHYTFNHTRIKSGLKKWMGVPHTEELPFVFGTPFVKTNEYTPEELEFSRKIIQLWTSFAKTGKPYTEMEEEWKPFTQQDRNSLYLTLGNLRLIKTTEYCKFWKDFYNFN